MEMIKVFLIDLPCTVYGFTTYAYGDDGQIYYSIFINAKLNSERQFMTYKHEIEHIDRGDFFSMRKADDIECFRHNIA